MQGIDAWVTEDNRLYIANPREHPIAELAEAANSLLLEWDYAEDNLLTAQTIYALPDVVWVDAETVGEERWPADRVHESEQGETIEVWTYDLDEIITRSNA